MHSWGWWECHLMRNLVINQIIKKFKSYEITKVIIITPWGHQCAYQVALVYTNIQVFGCRDKSAKLLEVQIKRLSALRLHHWGYDPKIFLHGQCIIIGKWCSTVQGTAKSIILVKSKIGAPDRHMQILKPWKRV